MQVVHKNEKTRITAKHCLPHSKFTDRWNSSGIDANQGMAVSFPSDYILFMAQ